MAQGKGACIFSVALTEVSHFLITIARNIHMQCKEASKVISFLIYESEISSGIDDLYY